MTKENKPSSEKARKVIEEFENQDKDGKHWTKILEAVNGIADDANVKNLSDSEKAEILHYLGGKIQNKSVI